MREKIFWNEARNRRNLFYIWFIGWLPFAAIFGALTKIIFGDQSYFVAFIIWAVSWGIVEARIRKLNCPKCKKQAFKHCFFFMRNAKCQHCGNSFRQITD